MVPDHRRLAWIELLCGLGLAVSAYLTVAHYSNAPLACVNTGIFNCDLVTRGSYGLVPFTAIPTALTGIFWFAVALALAVGLRRRPSPRLALGLLAWAIAGVATVLYLVYLELVVIHHVCEWCTVAHAAVAAILLLALSTAQDFARANDT